MNYLIYKIKNKLFSYSTEAKKYKRPSYNELILYKNFKITEKNHLALSFGAGRSGQNWFSKIFNSHDNWVGSAERFADYEAFYRYISYYNLPVHRESFFELIELSIKRDMALYQNSFIASPYFSFGVQELTNRLSPNFIFFNIRDPIKAVESFHRKGWYLNYDKKSNIKSPHINIFQNQYRSFSRIIPNDDYLDEWLNLSRIGKIIWFWCTINKSIYDSFRKIVNIEKYYVKLEDINQNYHIYENICEKFYFKNKMSKKKFFNTINKAPNKGKENKYLYRNWSNQEKNEFEKILNDFFTEYSEIKTNL